LDLKCRNRSGEPYYSSKKAEEREKGREKRHRNNLARGVVLHFGHPDNCVKSTEKPGEEEGKISRSQRDREKGRKSTMKPHFINAGGKQQNNEG